MQSFMRFHFLSYSFHEDFIFNILNTVLRVNSFMDLSLSYPIYYILRTLLRMNLFKIKFRSTKKISFSSSNHLLVFSKYMMLANTSFAKVECKHEIVVSLTLVSSSCCLICDIVGLRNASNTRFWTLSLTLALLLYGIHACPATFCRFYF